MNESNSAIAESPAQIHDGPTWQGDRPVAGNASPTHTQEERKSYQKGYNRGLQKGRQQAGGPAPWGRNQYRPNKAGNQDFFGQLASQSPMSLFGLAFCGIAAAAILKSVNGSR